MPLRNTESCEGELTVGTSVVTGWPPSRQEQIRNFLRLHNLRAWIAWRPDELLMLSGYFPFWGASLLLCFADAEPLLFVPQIEPRDHFPRDLRVQEYPWGDLKCGDPYSALVAAVGDQLTTNGVNAEQVGMNPGAFRTSLPISRNVCPRLLRSEFRISRIFIYERPQRKSMRSGWQTGLRTLGCGLSLRIRNRELPRRRLRQRWNRLFTGRLVATEYFIREAGLWYSPAPTVPMLADLIVRLGGD